jgi:hypothetical protein
MILSISWDYTLLLLLWTAESPTLPQVLRDYTHFELALLYEGNSLL